MALKIEAEQGAVGRERKGCQNSGKKDGSMGSRCPAGARSLLRETLVLGALVALFCVAAKGPDSDALCGKSNVFWLFTPPATQQSI